MPYPRPLPAVLQIYRSIRRLHKDLPPALRLVGNNYIRDEFRRHRTADAAFVSHFTAEWARYRDELASQIESQRRRDAEEVVIGRKLTREELDALSDEQVGQLSELRTAARGEERGKAGASGI
ncbi:uncharacterized protein EV422DRAFT_29245 [Fimicolochytrium jonesii]|uniref:uncharacterized protein n=1 Tax=Fimicolochytrium jonesii TaxID=1396493 RepID=UPI0022FE4B6C|nr:uncharacterized protein EV422DRAFT_29245 [Fimicolochytrium jonesii]KAI8827167.1 hypothetical protein EV422DRAFT_29245 [Fimicolochytrium jonesii]